MHKNNKHQQGYDFSKLTQAIPELNLFVFENNYGTTTMDFANPEAIKLLNKALLKIDYNINYWEFPDNHLCPPVPGRVDYLHHLADLAISSGLKKPLQVLDIGTGASCIYPLLGHSVYKWKFVGTEIDPDAIDNIRLIINRNELDQFIELRLQPNKSNILKAIIDDADSFDISMCNPPFYKNEQEAINATTRKLKGLKKDSVIPIRNFSGTANELWYEGGEKAFLHSYLYESSFYKDSCHWFTSLVSNKDLVKSMHKSLKKLGATQIKVINMSQGNKVSRIVAWSFLTEEQQKDWQS